MMVDSDHNDIKDESEEKIAQTLSDGQNEETDLPDESGMENSPFAKGDSPDFKWYVAKTMTGQENKVKKALKERVVNIGQTENFAEILVPEETVVSNVNGRKRTIKKKYFPGYVLLKMIMNDETWHLVKNTDKITGFVGGTSNRPAAISNDEAAYMIDQSKEGFQKPRTVVDLSEGDSVKVVEGPFATFVGMVESVTDKGKVRVNVSIFGRPTPVELDINQVEKVK